MSTTTALKKVVRKEVAKRLRTLSPAVLSEQSAHVTSHVLGMRAFQDAKNISIYVSLPHSEIETDVLIHHAFAKGKRVFIPFCPIDQPTVMKMLRVHHSDFQKLKENRWGIRELDPGEIDGLEDAEDPSLGGLDLVFVPGLAFDRSGQRLGHGRGYYDRFVTSLQDYQQRFSKPPPSTVALALREQVLPEGEQVPTTDHDRRPDIIVTPDGPLQVAKAE